MLLSLSRFTLSHTLVLVCVHRRLEYRVAHAQSLLIPLFRAQALSHPYITHQLQMLSSTSAALYLALVPSSLIVYL